MSLERNWTALALFVASLAVSLGTACAAPDRGPDAPAAPRTAVELPARMADAEGRMHDLAAVEGPILFVFWQTWCAPCRREAPELVAAAHARREVSFFGVVSGGDEDVDDGEVVDVAVALALPYPSLRDRDLILTELFGVTATPTVVVLDGERRVVYTGQSVPEDWSFAR